MKIEVKTYEESRLEFFKDLARKAEKKLDKCIRAMKQSDYDNPLSENHLALDDAVEIKGFYADIVCMLCTDKVAKWISVEERLPDTEVIAINTLEGTYGYKEMIIGYVFQDETYESGYGAENDNETLENVTHWMPLPEAPKERVEE